MCYIKVNINTLIVSRPLLGSLCKNDQLLVFIYDKKYKSKYATTVDTLSLEKNDKFTFKCIRNFEFHDVGHITIRLNGES